MGGSDFQLIVDFVSAGDIGRDGFDFLFFIRSLDRACAT